MLAVGVSFWHSSAACKGWFYIDSSGFTLWLYSRLRLSMTVGGATTGAPSFGASFLGIVHDSFVEYHRTASCTAQREVAKLFEIQVTGQA